MGSDVAMSWTLDDKDVQRALQNMVKENAKLRAEIATGVNEAKAAAAQEREWQKLREKATKEATQQMSQLNAAAQRIRESVATPFEEAKKKASELRDHLQAGRLTVDEYRLAYAKVAKEMKEASRDHAAEAEAARAAAAVKAEASRKAADAEREHSAAVREATAITDKLMTKEERYAANVAKLNALKDKGVLSVKSYGRALEAERKALEDTGNAGDKSGGLISGLTGKMAGFVGGLVGLRQLVVLVKQEYDALIERQGKSADANISLAGAQEQLLMNLGGADAAGVLTNVRKLSRSSGVKEENVTQAVNDAMAARADLGVDQVVNAVGSVSKIRKLAPSEMAGLAAATIDTQKQTGLGTDQALGFLLQLQGQARTKNLKSLAENMTPGVGAVMNFGADRATAGAMLASLSHGMGDTTGAQSKTSAIQLSRQLREFSPGNDIGSTVENLQRDPEARKKFLANASFEAQAIPAIESLLGGGVQAKQFSAARTALSADPMQALNDAIKARGASPALGVAELDQAFANAADQQKLASIKEAESSVIRKRMEELRNAMPGNALGKQFDGMLADLESGGMQSVDRTMAKLRSEVKYRQEGRSIESEAARQSSSPLFEAISGAANGNDGRTREQQIRDANLQDERYQKQTELLTEMVTLLERQLNQQQGNNNAGAVVGRRVNQMEGAP